MNLSRRASLLSSLILPLGAAALVATPTWAATLVQVGDSGKTYASSAVRCAADPAGDVLPVVEAGLFNPKRGASAVVSLNDVFVASVTAANPVADVFLVEDATNTIVVALNRKSADTYAFSVEPGMCDTSGNRSDGTLEYAASGKSYATVTPGCAFNPATGRGQPYVNLFDGKDGSGAYYLLNVSVDGVPLTQLSASKPHAPVFLGAGLNLITAAHGSLSVDRYLRDGGDGTCALP